MADEVDQPPRAGVAENPPWVPDVLVDDRDAGVVSGQQRPGTGEHDGIGVDVDDAGAGLDYPGHFVRAALAGQAGAEVNLTGKTHLTRARLTGTSARFMLKQFGAEQGRAGLWHCHATS